MTVQIKFLKKIRSPRYERVGSDTLVGPQEAEGPERYIFIMDGRFNYFEGILPHEETLEELAPNNGWYYGGNRYLPRDQHNQGLVITDPVAATVFMMSGHVG